MTHKLGTQNRNSLSLSLGGPIFGLREFKIFGAPDLGEFRSTALSLGGKVDRFWSPFFIQYFSKKMLISFLKK